MLIFFHRVAVRAAKRHWVRNRDTHYRLRPRGYRPFDRRPGQLQRAIDLAAGANPYRRQPVGAEALALALLLANLTPLCVRTAAATRLSRVRCRRRTRAPVAGAQRAIRHDRKPPGVPVVQFVPAF
jgi:hypothetical protein